MKLGFVKNRSETADYIIQKNIENLIVEWSMVDPLTLSDNFQVCDGSAWKTGSYAESYWVPKGRTTIPDIRGYHVRAHDYGAAIDPDRTDRRQQCSGTVAGNGLSVVVAKHYANAIYEAVLHSRSVVIAIKPATIFDTLVTYATVSSVDRITNTVYLATAITAGAQTLVIKGDVIGGFQKDAFQGFKVNHSITSGSATGNTYLVTGNSASYSNISPGMTLISDGTNGTPRTSSETRSNNISLLPIMWVRLPSTTVSSYQTKYKEGELGHEIRIMNTYKPISSEFPWLCLSLPDQTLSTANFPQDFIDVMRNKKVTYDELNTSTSSFSGTWASNVFTLTDNTANNEMLAELAEEYLFAGTPTTNWRILNDGTYDFNITGISVGSRQITVSNAQDTPGGTSISIYLYRVYKSTTSARHFSWAGLGLYMVGNNKISGLRRRDAMQGWQLGAAYDSAGARNYYGFAAGRDEQPARNVAANNSPPYLGTYGQGSTNMLKAMNDGTNGTPRTASKTRIESGTLNIYLYVGSYTA